jgi:hypothetical protein
MPAPTLTSLEERRLHAIAFMVLAVTGFTGIDT